METFFGFCRKPDLLCLKGIVMSFIKVIQYFLNIIEGIVRGFTVHLYVFHFVSYDCI